VACIPAGIDDGESSTELLLCLEVGDEAVGWAGPSRAVNCCTQAADKRERRKGLGRIRPGEKEKEENLFIFINHFLALNSNPIVMF
jgi:hypothetical protein